MRKHPRIFEILFPCYYYCYYYCLFKTTFNDHCCDCDYYYWFTLALLICLSWFKRFFLLMTVQLFWKSIVMARRWLARLADDDAFLRPRRWPPCYAASWRWMLPWQVAGRLRSRCPVMSWFKSHLRPSVYSFNGRNLLEWSSNLANYGAPGTVCHIFQGWDFFAHIQLWPNQRIL